MLTAETVPEAAPVQPHKTSLVCHRAKKISWSVIDFGHIQLLWTAGLLKHLFSLLLSPQTQLEEKWSTLQTQSFSCTESKGSERFPVHTARIKPQAQPAILSCSVLKDLALRAVLIRTDFFCFEIYASYAKPAAPPTNCSKLCAIHTLFNSLNVSQRGEPYYHLPYFCPHSFRSQHVYLT